MTDEAEAIEKELDGFCTCGARSADIDGYYPCTKDCITYCLRELIAAALKKEREDERERCMKVVRSLCFCRDANNQRVNEPKNCPTSQGYAEAIGRGES